MFVETLTIAFTARSNKTTAMGKQHIELYYFPYLTASNLLSKKL